MSDVIQVNVSMEIETANQLEKMAKEMGYDNRSAFVRWLIRQEYARRYSQPNPVITVEEALAQNSENRS
jgi:metal-responsive CopG/Arc/MetJ family transcriptional regulator